MVSGKTLVYGVIGNPVRHTVSPEIHGIFAAALGDDLIYAAFPVENDRVDEAIRGAHALGIMGLNVTIPHKRAVVEFASELDPMAAKIGSVNTLKYGESGYAGYNTDWIGITECLRSHCVSFSGKSVTVLGAGGSANAACVAAAEGGASKIAIFNRTVEKAEYLALRMKKYYNIEVTAAPLSEAFGSEIVYEATDAGFGTQRALSPVASAEFFRGVEFALEGIYTPWETEFLKQAAKAGVRAVNGFEMLVRQAAASYTIWTGKEVPEDVVSDAFERAGVIVRERG
ncbi:MAG: shikimate dehydrogenase [Defluviitaleaceae bacterium]|nr:shikimate dehydrogenase [Defluviitaleaceae bacterium]